MPTINSKDNIVTMLQNNGVYPGDSQALAIYSYINRSGNVKMYCVCYSESDIDNLFSSMEILTPYSLWTREFGLTHHGQREIENV